MKTTSALPKSPAEDISVDTLEIHRPESQPNETSINKSPESQPIYISSFHMRILDTAAVRHPLGSLNLGYRPERLAEEPANSRIKLISGQMGNLVLANLARNLSIQTPIPDLTRPRNHG